MSDIPQIDILYILEEMANPNSWVEDDTEHPIFIHRFGIPLHEVAKVAFELAKQAYLVEPKGNGE